MMGLQEVEFYGGPFCGMVEKVPGPALCITVLGGPSLGYYHLTNRV